MDKARLMLVDDHALFRSALASLISRQPDMEVTCEADSGESAIQLADQMRPDMILMDINLSGMDGLEAARAIKSRLADVKICMLTASDDDDLLFEAVRAGAEGYLIKHLHPDEFLAEVRRQLQGDAVISEEVALRIVRAAQGRAQVSETEGLGLITERELEVLRLIGQGLTNREIAQTLKIAENTAKNHLRNILAKLHFDNRVQAAAFAVRHGLVQE